nr:hypothetical protein OG999_19820 [Streptomyces sp. NBC_00886]
MEQRIGSSSQPVKGEPVKGAGFDPAFIPGLTAPAVSSDEPEDDTKPEDAETEAEESEGEESPVEDAEAEAEKAVAEADDPDEADEEDEDAEGPVFEASDRRAKIVADHKGVRLALDDQACEFRWDEIGAIETESPRFGKRFTITVHTPDRRWYPLEIEATARSRFTEWETQLDAVLDAYFEDEEDAEGSVEVDED